MGFWTFLQIAFDVFAALGLFLVISKAMRPAKDDPRLSRGLQILQSKISILEDLSDRSETQVRQLMNLLDQKNIETQNQIEKAKEQVHRVQEAINSSLEVAQIFQDKIPHQEIIERQNSLKYLKAAFLAHQGEPSQNIAQNLDLPLSEVEFIAKINSERLSFSLNDLPAWAKSEIELLQANQAAPPTQASAPMFGQLTNPSMPNTAFTESPLEIKPGQPEFYDYSPSAEIAHLAHESNENAFSIKASREQRVNQQIQPNLETLKRTQSLIENLEKQFSMPRASMEERESAQPQAAPEYEAMSMPTAPVTHTTPAIPTVTAHAEAPASANTNFAVALTAAGVQQNEFHLGSKVQPKADQPQAVVRKVIFPSIQAPRTTGRGLNQR